MGRTPSNEMAMAASTIVKSSTVISLPEIARIDVDKLLGNGEPNENPDIPRDNDSNAF